MSWPWNAIVFLGVLSVIVGALMVACIKAESKMKTPKERQMEDDEQMKFCSKHLK